MEVPGGAVSSLHKNRLRQANWHEKLQLLNHFPVELSVAIKSGHSSQQPTAITAQHRTLLRWSTVDLGHGTYSAKAAGPNETFLRGRRFYVGSWVHSATHRLPRAFSRARPPTHNSGNTYCPKLNDQPRRPHTTDLTYHVVKRGTTFVISRTVWTVWQLRSWRWSRTWSAYP